ncbi:MAG: uracil-DNA glycosylase, partial [Campylobacterota bacterium]|nr:uracil-DNA glycosylase [Campylobacterota bacterium]
MKSYQNSILLQNLYKLKSLGFHYIDSFNFNKEGNYNQALSFNQLIADISTCHLCDLSKSRSQSMFGCGNTQAKVMIIDFKISQSQDKENSYYIGRSGEILKNMIENI